MFWPKTNGAWQPRRKTSSRYIAFSFSDRETKEKESSFKAECPVLWHHDPQTMSSENDIITWHYLVRIVVASSWIKFSVNRKTSCHGKISFFFNSLYWSRVLWVLGNLACEANPERYLTRITSSLASDKTHLSLY